jgi:hypothetical protein
LLLGSFKIAVKVGKVSFCLMINSDDIVYPNPVNFADTTD